MTELDGFDQVPATTPGGTYTGAPWRIVLHTTEGWTAEGAIGAYRGHGGWPHFTVDPKWRRRYQHYPLGVSARALKNLSGGVETNRANAIQIEIVGTAATSQDLTPEDLDWFGREVIAPIRAEVSVQLVAPKFVGTEAGTIASASAPQRMSHDVWLGFNGVCGHQHVPENDHWDPGRLDVARILTAANPMEDDMTDAEREQLGQTLTLATAAARDAAAALEAVEEIRELVVPLLRERDGSRYARLKYIVRTAPDQDALARKIVSLLPDGKLTTSQLEAAVANAIKALDKALDED